MWKWLILTALAVTVIVALTLVPKPPGNGTFNLENISVTEEGELKRLTDKTLTYVDWNGTEWDAPVGTLTDGATVPRIALPITDGRFDRSFLKAAVVHDAYCQEENKDRTPEQYRRRRWQAVHKMFYEACIAGGTPELIAKIMFAGVWLGGPRWDDPDTGIQEVSNELLTRGFAGSKDWIEKNNPSIDQIIADIEKREPILVNLQSFETNVKAAMRAGDTTRANALLRDEQALVERELAKNPEDSMLLLSKGQVYKKRAMLYRQMNENNKAELELIRSEQAYKEVIENDNDNPIALHELGSVAVLRGDLELGKEFVNKALSVAPGYEVAKRDLQSLDIKQLRNQPAIEKRN